ncbi:DUF2066 domain-containing protein [Pseudomonas sp. TMP25]|uniref:DUF2066 domain-containing protein n=1 Tax=Pseudomonas sp. TMP25 TaxID=3136561 RepID=UPI003100DBC6
MRFATRLLLACLSFVALPAFAAPVSDLYQVREAVSSQQPEERAAALSRALDTLVLRLTGKTDAAQSPALAALRNDPQQIVSQFSYEGEVLQVDFDPLSTERSMRQAGLALWGANRPSILLWWLSDASDGSRLLGDGQEAAAPFMQAAQHRGLPLRLPLADLAEQLLAVPENLTSNQPAALSEASERYAADALLAVLAREANGQWQAEWRLWLGDEREQGTVKGADQSALADAILREVSQRLAPRFIVAAGAATGLTVEVRGVDLARYAELQRILEPFAAQLRTVQGDTLTFSVNANADQLRAQLSLARLQEVPADVPPVDADPAVTPPVTAAEPATSNVAQGTVLRFSW